MRILCVGGGPAGLYAAVVLKEADRSREVVLVERNAAGVTGGFGVVFSEPTLQHVADEDPSLYAALVGHAQRWDAIEVRLGDRVVRCAGQGFAAISRHTLLRLLHDRAVAAGVDVRYGTEVADPSSLGAFDVIVAADGSHSALRTRYARELGASVSLSSARYVWFGTRKRFDCLTFLFERNEHGAFGVHAYPHREEESTFIVEADEGAWRRAGLADLPPSEVEAKSKSYCEQLFARHLGGQGLLGNRSAWHAFRTVRTARWSHGNVLLMGDAAHTAHFSVGSGTKMALDDALALRAALAHATRVEEAAAAFEKARRPEVERLQSSAAPSLYWWEHFDRTLWMSPEEFVFHFLTRNHRVTRGSLARRDPDLVAIAERHFAGAEGVAPSRVALRLRGVVLSARIVRGSVGTVLQPGDGLARLPPLLASGVKVVELAGAPQELTEIVPAARAAWPGDCPLAVRVEARLLETIDSVGWARDLARSGVDLIVVVEASGAAPSVATRMMIDAMRNGARVPIALAAEGLDADEIETLLLSGRVDVYVDLSGAP